MKIVRLPPGKSHLYSFVIHTRFSENNLMTLFSSQPGDEGLPGPARARVMAAIMTTTLMGVFDGTMINIALPSMAQEMQVPASIAVWFANGYLLAAAMTLANIPR